MNKLACLFCCLFLSISAAEAKPNELRKAWVRKFPGLWLGISSDNLGHIVAAGRETTPDGSPTNQPHVLLLNREGRKIKDVLTPSTSIAIDTAGRVFMTWRGEGLESNQVSCAAYAP